MTPCPTSPADNGRLEQEAPGQPKIEHLTRSFSKPVMAVTDLRCNAPLWRFHRGPDLVLPIHSTSNPEALRFRPWVVPSNLDIKKIHDSKIAAQETGGGAQSVCFLSCPSATLPAGLLSGCTQRPPEWVSGSRIALTGSAVGSASWHYIGDASALQTGSPGCRDCWFVDIT